MKTILVPTDFSNNAQNAIDYAATLAEKMQSRLVLFHAYWLPMYEDEEIDSPEDLAIREKALQQEKQIQDEIATNLLAIKQSLLNVYPMLQVDYTFSNGLPVDEILTQVQLQQAGLVVMGTKGASGVKEIILGSNAANVVERCSCPVLVIPKEALWRGISNIVFATDYHDSELHDIFFLAEISALFKARLIIVHIGEDSFWASDKHSSARLDLLKSKVEQHIAYPSIEFDFIESSDTVKALQIYAEAHQADILAMSTHKRSLLEKIFGKSSLTLQMAFHSHIPLLAFKAETTSH